MAERRADCPRGPGRAKQGGHLPIGHDFSAWHLRDQAIDMGKKARRTVCHSLLRSQHPKLLEQPEHVPREPDFFNFFVRYAIQGHTRDHDFLARWRNAHEIAVVRAVKGPAGDHFFLRARQNPLS